MNTEMLAELHQKILETVETLRRKTALIQEKQTAEGRLERLRREQRDLEEHARQCKARLQALEGTSLRAGWHALLGDRDEQIARTRQELQDLERQVRNTRRAVEEAESRLLGLEAQLKPLAGVEETFENLLSQKEQALLAANHPLSRQLQALHQRQQGLRAEKRETAEALQAGLEALDRLKEAISALESASGMGVWDMLGGGTLVSAFKHSRIHDARALLERAQDALNRFGRELRDIQEHPEPVLPIGGLELFFDVFADGILVDVWVQSKISSALERARDQQDALTAALNRLNRHFRQLEQEEADLRQRRREILTTPL